MEQWGKYKPYSKGITVNHNGGVYEALSNNMGAAPHESPMWKHVGEHLGELEHTVTDSKSPQDIPLAAPLHDQNKVYSKDSIVKHDGRNYRARTGTYGTTPGSHDSWEPLDKSSPTNRHVQETLQRSKEVTHLTVHQHGHDGKDGRDGRQGLQGLRGEQGLQGIPGIQGEKGAKGDKGERGERGEAGLEGRPGLQGPPGEVKDRYIFGSNQRMRLFSEGIGVSLIEKENRHATGLKSLAAGSGITIVDSGTGTLTLSASGGGGGSYTSITSVPTNTILGNNTGSTANAIALTPEQVNTLLGTSGGPFLPLNGGTMSGSLNVQNSGYDGVYSNYYGGYSGAMPTFVDGINLFNQNLIDAAEISGSNAGYTYYLGNGSSAAEFDGGSITTQLGGSSSYGVGGLYSANGSGDYVTIMNDNIGNTFTNTSNSYPAIVFQDNSGNYGYAATGYVALATSGAGSGFTANLCDSSAGAAGNFNWDSSFIAQLAVSAGPAGYFFDGATTADLATGTQAFYGNDGTNTTALCDGTYAVNATGESFFDGYASFSSHGTIAVTKYQNGNAGGWSAADVYSYLGRQVGGFGYGNVSVGNFPDAMYMFSQAKDIVLSNTGSGTRYFVLSGTSGNVLINNPSDDGSSRLQVNGHARAVDFTTDGSNYYKLGAHSTGTQTQAGYLSITVNGTVYKVLTA